MPTSKLTVLGIDPGLGRLGYGVVHQEGQQLSLRAYGVVETHQRRSVGQRLDELHQAILALIDHHHPDRMAIEQLYISRNIRTAVVVGEARGIALLAASERSLPIHECSPQAVKLAVTGYGQAEKRQVQRMVQTIFHLRRPPQPDDAADAVAVAICGLQT